MPSESQLLGYYPEDYYAYVPQKRSIWWKQLLKHFLSLTLYTHDPEFCGSGTFLDIGCGSGNYLQIMSKRGWKVWGVEPSSYGAHAGRNAGFDVSMAHS